MLEKHNLDMGQVYCFCGQMLGVLYILLFIRGFYVEVILPCNCTFFSK